MRSYGESLEVVRRPFEKEPLFLSGKPKLSSMFTLFTRAPHLLLAPSTGRYSVRLYRFMQKSRYFIQEQ